jgi:hypothetical protein
LWVGKAYQHVVLVNFRSFNNVLNSTLLNELSLEAVRPPLAV